MEHPQPKSRATAPYAARLDHTLRALQDRVKQQEAILEELRASTTSFETEPSADPRSHLLQLRALKAAYETLTPQQPWLPSPESPLPALLAIRGTHVCIKDTQKCIAQSEDDLKEAQKRLEKEQAFLADAKLIQSDLELRISSLQGEMDERIQKSASQASKDMLREMEKKKTYYDRQTGNLVKAFNRFIDDHLAPMLAAEELGGPIVGEMLDVNEVVLEAGFSAQGKAKKAKANPDEDRRQRRIDEIWGPRPLEDDAKKEPWDEKRAAAAEMRELTELLLNSLVEAGGIGPGAYIELTRESAAARFLVRSKVAQLHPRDARRIRLVDFGGQFDE
ncbi:hypothetical protein G7Y89_g9334 [Cudoniella acicularis]|uniref:Uncharacterized protein n=1 Tax=Cudoniella acicularis TaxID=354080 RepID=A0A8H4RH31_9HELO|nr:hypothetical protein G7Y89_g9334 [Cudoniella acicularis]